MAMMIDSMVNIRDFELMVSDTDMSKAGKGPMNIEIHLALADELITRLREAEMDAARYRWLCEQTWFQVESEWQLILGETETEDDFIICANEKIDQAMKEKGDE